MSTIETIYRTAEGHGPEIGAPKRTAKGSLGSALTWLGALFERRRSRLALLEMSDEQLKDIGVSRADAYREAHLPMWN